MGCGASSQRGAVLPYDGPPDNTDGSSHNKHSANATLPRQRPLSAIQSISEESENPSMDQVEEPELKQMKPVVESVPVAPPLAKRKVHKPAAPASNMEKYISPEVMQYLPPGLRAIDIEAKFDPADEDEWEAYLERTQEAEQYLRDLYDRTPRRPLPPFPEHVQYVRPFLSSTFRDFNDERDHVFKTAFTQVEKLASQRGLFFAPLDLRWGVTSEQSNGGEVVKICLEEIDRSRPFFVASLGFRNGWAMHPMDPPDASWVQLLKKTIDIGEECFPWVKEYRDKSVTEMEILHGMLREHEDTPKTARPFVYMRTVDFLRKNVSLDMRSTFAEMGYAEIMLFDLKRRIIEAGFAISFFSTPAEWADNLQKDLTVCIERDFPLEKHTPIERELADHKSFARTRTRCFVGRQNVLEVLDEYVGSGGNGLGIGGSVEECQVTEEKEDHTDVVSVCVSSNGDGLNSMKHGMGLSMDTDGTRHGTGNGVGASGMDVGISSSRSLPLLHINSNGKPGGSGPSSTKNGISSIKNGILSTRNGDIFSQLDDSILPMNNDVNAPILLLASSGMGKSSVLACWVDQLKQRQHNLHTLTTTTTATAATTGKNGTGTKPQNLILHTTAAMVQERYIGATADSTLSSTLLLWILEELVQQLGPLTVDGAPMNKQGTGSAVPTSATDIMEQFGDWLEAAAKKQSILLVFDGLDQLAADNDGHYLSWLPSSLPAGVKLVCSSVPGHLTAQQCLAKGFRVLSLAPLTDDEARALCVRYLGLFGKQLDKTQTDTILSSPRTRDPLYLTTLLQEVRVYGSYEGLMDRIRYYLTAEDTTAMYLKVITHLEQDFNSEDVPELVQYTLAILACARSGINEHELRCVLHSALHISEKNIPFPTLTFSALLIRLESCLIDQHGLKIFSHQYLRDAINIHYLGGPKGKLLKKQCHEYLVQYFSSIPACGRKVQELPWHLYSLCRDAVKTDVPLSDRNVLLAPAVPNTPTNTSTTSSSSSSSSSAATGDKDASGDVPSRATAVHVCALDHTLAEPLVDVLTDLILFPFFSLTEFKFDLHKYWSFLEQHCSSYSRPAKAYYQSLKKYQAQYPDVPPLEFSKMCHDIGYFLASTDRYNGADVFFDQALAIESEEKGKYHPDVEILTTLKANLLYKQGRYQDALPLYESSLHIIEKNSALLDSTRGPILRIALANLLKEQGQYDDALQLYNISLRKQRQIHGEKSTAVAVTLCNIAEIYLRQRDDKEQQAKALTMYEQALSIAEKLKGQSHPMVGSILSSIGGAYNQLGFNGKAKVMFERALVIKENALGKQHVGVCVVLNNLATTLVNEGRYADAMQYYQRALEIREKTQGIDHPHVAPTLCNIARLYIAITEAEDDSASGAAEAERVYSNPRMGVTDGLQATAAALTFFKRAMAILEGSFGGQHHSLLEVLDEMAKANVLAGMYTDALADLQRMLQIYMVDRTSESESIAQVLHRQAVIYDTYVHNKARALECLHTECGVWDVLVKKEDEKESNSVEELEKSKKNPLDSCKYKFSTTLLVLGTMYLELEKSDDALNCFYRAYILRKRTPGLGPLHEETMECKQWVYDVAVSDPEEVSFEDFDPDTMFEKVEA